MPVAAVKYLACASTIIGLIAPPAVAKASTCSIQNASPPGSWKFVRVYDADTGELVLGQAVNGGDKKAVTVSRQRVRVQYKLAGDVNYNTGIVAACRRGNVVRI